MVRTKALADAMTSGRFFLGLYLLWLARRDPRGLHTWIGDHDLEADLVVALGSWVYLALAGFVSFGLAVAYGAAAAAALWHFGSIQLAWGLQALPYGAMIWTALRVVPPYGLLLIAWIDLVLVATWPRFPQQTLPEFLVGIRSVLRRR